MGTISKPSSVGKSYRFSTIALNTTMMYGKSTYNLTSLLYNFKDLSIYMGSNGTSVSIRNTGTTSKGVLLIHATDINSNIKIHSPTLRIVKHIFCGMRVT